MTVNGGRHQRLRLWNGTDGSAAREPVGRDVRSDVHPLPDLWRGRLASADVDETGRGGQLGRQASENGDRVIVLANPAEADHRGIPAWRTAISSTPS